MDCGLWLLPCSELLVMVHFTVHLHDMALLSAHSAEVHCNWPVTGHQWKFWTIRNPKSVVFNTHKIIGTKNYRTWMIRFMNSIVWTIAKMPGTIHVALQPFIRFHVSSSFQQVTIHLQNMDDMIGFRGDYTLSQLCVVLLILSPELVIVPRKDRS